METLEQSPPRGMVECRQECGVQLESSSFTLAASAKALGNWFRHAIAFGSRVGAHWTSRARTGFVALSH